ncbi:MAG: hypothetical protein EBR82_39510 [Caulobacteraceae bacterium]|nr:hypothetical protein [Caulobacteraceae bacterium]
MTFSRPILATAPNKVKMNWWEYWVGHCWMTGWQSIRSNFRIWGDLIGSLNEDDVYEKEFLEYLMQMVDDIETGKEKVYPMDTVMANLKNKWGEKDDEVE